MSSDIEIRVGWLSWLWLADGLPCGKLGMSIGERERVREKCVTSAATAAGTSRRTDMNMSMMSKTAAPF